MVAIETFGHNFNPSHSFLDLCLLWRKKRNFREKGDAAMILHVGCKVHCLKKVRHEIQSIL